MAENQKFNALNLTTIPFDEQACIFENRVYPCRRSRRLETFARFVTRPVDAAISHDAVSVQGTASHDTLVP